MSKLTQQQLEEMDDLDNEYMKEVIDDFKPLPPIGHPLRVAFNEFRRTPEYQRLVEYAQEFDANSLGNKIEVDFRYTDRALFEAYAAGFKAGAVK
jgi:hypothetical protein